MRAKWLSTMMVVALSLPSLAVTDADRTPVYQQFRSLFDAQRYADALPVAQRLVTLTEEQYAGDDLHLVGPLVNLATTQYRMKDYAAAEESYVRAVRILEAKSTPTDRALIRTLHGLGMTYVAAGQPDNAVTVLRRAADLSRNLEGLFNPEQLAILEPLIESYVATGRLAEAEKEHQYAFRVAETSFGKTDPRMLEPLERYARWFEFAGRYTTARALHARALGIAERTAGRESPLIVDPLRGVARTYRLEYLYGPEPLDTASPSNPFDLDPVMPDLNAAGRLDADGERALRLALQVIERNAPVDKLKRGQTLIELGDWYLSGAAVNKALESYRKAWADLQEAGSAQILAAPEPIVYRAPPSSITRTKLTPEEYDAVPVSVRFTVRRDGRLDNINVASSNASEPLTRSVVSALRKARYRPRMDGGEPVDTPDVLLTERLAVRRPEPPRS